MNPDTSTELAGIKRERKNVETFSKKHQGFLTDLIKFESKKFLPPFSSGVLGDCLYGVQKGIA